MTNRTVADTILAQLGGNRFFAMTGARHVSFGERDVSFHLPRAAAKRINHIKVILAGDDTYTVEFRNVARSTGMPTMIHTSTGIYNDMLRDVFTMHTGLFTSLAG